MRGMINLLGPLFTRAFKPGASEVKSINATIASPTTTKATLLTPTSGKKARIISVIMMTSSAQNANFEMYFGTGANFTVDRSKIIVVCQLDEDLAPNFGISFPDGGGPVGAVDEIVSIRTGTDVLVNNCQFTIHYREE